jgi:uncharacterized phiE125 gp8 family phage protein
MALTITYPPGLAGGCTPHFAIALRTPPVAEPLSLELAKIVLRVDDPFQDAWIAQQVTAARETVERDTGRWIAEAAYTVTYDAIPAAGVLTLPRGPVLTVEAIRVVDAAGVAVVIPASEYVIDTSEPPRLALGAVSAASWWPAAGVRPRGALEVDLVAGETPAPGWAVQAIALLLELWRVPRAEEATTTAYDALIAPYVIPGMI